MSCVVRWWDVLFVKGMHFSSKNARLLNFKRRKAQSVYSSNLMGTDCQIFFHFLSYLVCNVNI